MKKAVLTVSFGTSYETALEKSISAVECDFAENLADYDVYRAFTSEMIINILNRRGIKIDNLDEAFQKLLRAGYDKVIVQPTHVIGGEEYNKLCLLADKYRDSFSKLKIGVPLLNSYDDIKNVCDFFRNRFCTDNKLLLLMGHGTEHNINNTYSEMNKICAELGYSDIFVSTIKERSKSAVDKVLERLKYSNCNKTVLVPLMLVAGEHVNKDMAGDEPDSWKSKLESEGVEVDTVITGIGEYPEIRELYTKHLRRAAEEFCVPLNT